MKEILKKGLAVMLLLAAVYCLTCGALAACGVLRAEESAEGGLPRAQGALAMTEEWGRDEKTVPDVEPTAPEREAVRIEYREVKVPVEIPAEPVFVKQYIEVVAHNENRFSALEITEEDRELMAAIVWHEARGECFTGQRMAAEVILNRVLSEKFPDTVSEVVYQKNQFTSAGYVSSAQPDETQRAAVSAAISETPITDADVLFFSQGAYNDNVFARIGGHVFCRG